MQSEATLRARAHVGADAGGARARDSLTGVDGERRTSTSTSHGNSRRVERLVQYQRWQQLLQEAQELAILPKLNPKP